MSAPTQQPNRSRRLKTKKGEGLWLMSFSDMSLLLLSFFALMLSMSKVDKQKFDNLNEGMSAKVAEQAQTRQNLKSISEKIAQEIKKRKLDNVAQVTFDIDGVAIEFSDRLVFGVGSADPNPDFAQITDQVMGVIAKSPDKYRIVLEGHTDDTPLSGLGTFKTNWDLSSARGVTLLRQFRKRGVDEGRMSVVSYAHTRPKIAIEGKVGQQLELARAANRRVVIRLQ